MLLSPIFLSARSTMRSSTFASRYPAKTMISAPRSAGISCAEDFGEARLETCRGNSAVRWVLAGGEAWVHGWRSRARTALAIEDDASTTTRTEQPLPRPGVAKTERSAADPAHASAHCRREDRWAARQRQSARESPALPRDRRSPDQPRRPHSTLSTTFPKLLGRGQALVRRLPVRQGPDAVHRGQQAPGAAARVRSRRTPRHSPWSNREWSTDSRTGA